MKELRVQNAVLPITPGVETSSVHLARKSFNVSALRVETSRDWIRTGAPFQKKSDRVRQPHGFPLLG